MNPDYFKKWREDNRKKIREYTKQWRKNNREKLNQKQKEWSRKNPGYLKKWRKNQPDYEIRQHELKKKTGAAQAKGSVYHAVKKGVLKKLSESFVKCSDCDDRATEYDHRDYNLPLEVDPVCHSCNLNRGPAIPIKEE